MNTRPENKSIQHRFPRLLPDIDLSQQAGLLLLFAWLILLWFDVDWCIGTTFTGMSYPATYVNSLLLAMIVSIPVLLFKARRVQWAVLFLLAAWLEANLLYSRTYFTLIPLSSYGLVSNLSDFGASVFDSFRWADIGFIIIWGSAVWLTHKKPIKSTPKGVWIWTIGGIFLLFAGFVTRCISHGGFNGYWDSFSDANHHSCRAVVLTPIASIIHDALAVSTPLTTSERNAVDNWLQKHKHDYPIGQNLADSIRPENIVLILCESLESWPIGLKLEGKEITPNLNRLIADSSSFFAPRILTQVGAGRSIDAQLLINAGLLPPESGVYSMDMPQNTYYTLTKAFKEAYPGARSYILTVDKPIVWNQQAIGRAFGFDTIIARDSWVNDEKTGGRGKLGDRSFMRQIAAKMHNGDIWPEGENAFVQIVTYSGHNPFIIPDSLDKLKLTGDYPEILRRYLSVTHYTDEALGNFVDKLKQRTDFDRTMVIITGDHEGLASYRTELATEQFPWVSAERLTPLIILNSPQGGQFSHTAGQVDIYPTLLHLAGLGIYQWHGLGIDMLSESHPGAAVALGNIEGNCVSDSTARHLREATEISTTILRHNLLNE